MQQPYKTNYEISIEIVSQATKLWIKQPRNTQNFNSKVTQHKSSNNIALKFQIRQLYNTQNYEYINN